jgi:hypothetical protein
VQEAAEEKSEAFGGSRRSSTSSQSGTANPKTSVLSPSHMLFCEQKFLQRPRICEKPPQESGHEASQVIHDE